MSKTGKIILFILLILGLAAAGYWGYRYFVQSQKSNVPVLSAVSPSAVFFIETANPPGALSSLSSSDLWNHFLQLEGIHQFEQQFHLIDSITKTNHDVLSYLSASNLIITMNPDEQNRLVPVILCAHSNPIKASSVDNLFAKIVGTESIVMEKMYKNAPIKIVNIPRQNTFFYYSFYRGIFAGSLSESLIMETINQINEGEELSSNPTFRRVRETAGHNVDANLYVNGPGFGKWLQGLSSVRYKGAFAELTRFWDWTEADIVVNKDELLLNGYSVADDENSRFINCFKQDPQDITIPEVLPNTTAYMLHIGLAAFDKFYVRFIKSRSDSTETLEALKKLNDQFGIAPYDEFISWIGSEVAIAGINGPSDRIDPVVVIRATDILKARISLLGVAKKVDKRKLARTEEINYEDYKIYKLNLPEFNDVLFGSLFSVVDENYFVLIKDYVLMANSPEVLQALIDTFYKGKTLAGDLNYQTFSNNISLRSNIFLYSNIRKSADNAPKLFRAPFSDWLEDNSGALGNLEGLALQLSFINQMFYTNIYLKYNPDYKQVNPSSWEFETEGKVVGRPYMIRNHRNNKLNTIVFDDLHNMYLADHIGKVKWKLPLIEAPLSDLISVDYFDNGKNQYLFNTQNYVYIVDLNGDYVADFPVRLPQSAIGPVACFDYDNNKDYRFVIPLNDNRIYNFDKEMKLVDGWNKIQARAAVLQAVEHLVANEKDYFIVKDVNGNVLITDRRGEERISLGNKVEVSKNNKFYLNKTNSNGIFITTKPTGELLYFSENGATKSTSFGNFSPDHYFFYFDFNGDGSDDFIFIDGMKFIAFDRFKKVILEYHLPQTVEITPLIFKSPLGETVIAIVLQKSGEIIFLNSAGRIFEKETLTSTAGVAIGGINDDSDMNVIVPKEKKVWNYQLER